MKVIFMQKVADVSEWKFAIAVSVGVLLSITHNVSQIKNRATYMQSLIINHNSKACFLFAVIN